MNVCVKHIFKKMQVLAKDYKDPRAPIHIVTGAGGCNLRWGLCFDPILGPMGDWSAYRSWFPGLFGYGRLTVHNQYVTSLHSKKKKKTI